MPFTKGHVLFSPKNPESLVQNLSLEESEAFFTELKMLSEAYKRLLGEESVNIIIQNGVQAGQTVHHIHAHLIPECRLVDRLNEGNLRKEKVKRSEENMALEALWIRENLDFEF